MRRRTLLAAVLAPVAVTAACRGRAGLPSADGTPLPAAPTLSTGKSLVATLTRRRSVRAYSRTRLAEHEVGQLCWAAQGITSEEGLRTAPSAGALYPLELYVVLPEGVHRYRPDGHRLEHLSASDLRPDLADAALGQAAVREAPAVFVVTGTVSRTAARYGGRAERYVLLEAGHAAQNLLLQAVALGLGGVPVGAFDDDAAHEVLRLPRGERVIYLLPVGRPGS
jgi:SagB-type dehydrogenase family enzyme